MKKLYVFYEQENIGVLKQDDDLIYSFQYDDSWLRSSQRFSLSGGLPLKSELFGNKATFAFFENLLPEGDVKEDLKRATGVEGTFDFLAKYGQDCAGAISLSKEKNYPVQTDPLKRREIKLGKIYQAIDEKQSVSSVIAEEEPGYLSLAGAQDKFAVIWEGKKFFLPISGGPTSHIVKVPIWRLGVKDSVYNEYFCMTLAKEIGFTIPNCYIYEGEFPLFIIDRYDREH